MKPDGTIGVTRISGGNAENGYEAVQGEQGSALIVPIPLYELDDQPVHVLQGVSSQQVTESGNLSSQDKRLAVIEAALIIIADRGLRGSTLDIIANECGCSRATLYRLFPGGRDTIFNAIASTETARLFSAIASSMLPAANVSEAISAGIYEAARFLEGHRALQKLLKDEPDTILPFLAFDGFESMLDQVVAFARPFLERWIDKETAKRVVSWAARLTISYLLCPAEGIDLAGRDAVTRLVDTYIMPGVDILVGSEHEQGGVYRETFSGRSHLSNAPANLPKSGSKRIGKRGKR